MTVTVAVQPGEPADAPRTLRAQVASGVAWSMSASIAMQVSRAAVAIVLARLLTPADYGLAGMALLFTSLVLIVSDVSLGAALVQRPTIDEVDRSTVFWATAAIGILLTVGGVAASGAIAAFFKQPEVQPLFAVMSISFVLVSLQMTQASLLQREMRFKAMSIRAAASVVAGSVVGVSTAVLGGGAWALIAQQLAISSTSVLLLWMLSPWRPRLVFSPARLRSLGGFGLSVSGARLIDYANRNADNILVGRYLGTASLGAYSVAYSIMLLPLTRLIFPIQEALFPAYSRVQGDTRHVGDIWLRVTTVVSAVIVPAMVGLAVVAPDFVHVVLGSRWSSAGPVLRILALVVLVQAISSLGQKTLEAINRAGTVLWFSAGGLIPTIGSFVIGLHWGIVGVAVAYACVAIPIAVGFVIVVARTLEVSLRRVGACLRGPLECAAVMAAATIGVRSSLEATPVSDIARLALVIVTGAVVYVPLCAWRVPIVRTEVRNIISSRRNPTIAVGQAST